MSSDQNIKNVLKKHHLAPSKKLGQNFLVNPEISSQIVKKAGVTPDDTVVELGVGLGSLTIPLAQQVKRIIGLEIDAGIVQYHQENQDLPSNVTLIHQDLLTADFKKLANECGGKLKILANLPYSISNPLLFKLIENKDAMESAVLMLQKEVGQRLTAREGTKEYGVLSVLLGSCASVETLLKVSPANFHPRPKVDSVVVRIVFHPIPERAKNLPLYNHKLLQNIVNGAFQKRRKTLLNALSTASKLSLSKEEVLQVLTKSDISPKIRAERLTIEDFVRLTRSFSNQLSANS